MNYFDKTIKLNERQEVMVVNRVPKLPALCLNSAEGVISFYYIAPSIKRK
jgi:hypothetical protein